MDQHPIERALSGLDEITAGFAIASMKACNALAQDQEDTLNRYNLVRNAGGVLWMLLRSMEYPRDQSLIPEIADIALNLTGFLDQILLNAEPGDAGLQALQQMAKSQPMWPTLVRPGDAKFTRQKLARLSVGESGPLGALGRNAKHPASMATANNRLARRLVLELNSGVQLCFPFGPNGVLTDEQVRIVLRVMKLEIPEWKHCQLREIFRVASQYPFSENHVRQWTEILTEFVLCIGLAEGLQKYPELRQVKSIKSPTAIKTEPAKLRWKLKKILPPVLRKLAR